MSFIIPLRGIENLCIRTIAQLYIFSAAAAGGIYNCPMNQPGRRSRSRAEPGALRGRSPVSALNLLNPLAFGNTGPRRQ